MFPIPSTHRPALPITLGLTLSLFASACTDDAGDDEGMSESLSIVGDYVDEWGDAHTITESTWANGAGAFHIDEYDDADQWLVAQNDAANEYNPEQWSRFEWTFVDGALYYCQAVFDGASKDDALAGGADPDDLSTGCGGFAWTLLDA